MVQMHVTSAARPAFVAPFSDAHVGDYQACCSVCSNVTRSSCCYWCLQFRTIDRGGGAQPGISLCIEGLPRARCRGAGVLLLGFKVYDLHVQQFKSA